MASKKVKLTALLQVILIVGTGLSFVYQPPKITVALVFFNSLLWPLTLSYIFIEVLKKKKQQLQNNPLQSMNKMAEQLGERMEEQKEDN